MQRMFISLLLLISFLFISCRTTNKTADVLDQEFLLRSAIEKKLKARFNNYGKVHFGLIAEVVRGDIRAAIIWPGIANGKIIDNDIVGFAFQKSKNGWITIKEDFTVAGPEKLAEIMGGSDYKIIKPDGVPIDILGQYIFDELHRFRKYYENGDPGKAMIAFESLTRAFSIDLSCFNDAVPEIVIRNMDEKYTLKKPIKIKNFNATGKRGTAICILDASRIFRIKASLIRGKDGWTVDDLGKAD